LKNIALAAGFTQTGTRNDYYQFNYTSTQYEIQLAEQFDLETTYNITANKLITTDAPWNIFAIPYSDSLQIVNQEDGSVLIEKTNANISLNAIMSMQKNHPGIIYDVQILPYCPVPKLIQDIDVIEVTNEKEYSLIMSGGENPQPVGIIFNVPESRFSTNLEGYSILGGQTSIEKKLNNQCDKWRICSPNYSNYFDFSVEKNGGVQYFNVDCEYKPFTPYIHINPNFDNLYGEDFNDVRGLVCGGDFSLSQIIDQWEQYQIQNKNFQNIFDRQIQNMEVQHKIGRVQDVVGSIAGVGQGAASGALTGGMIGGGYGAVAGAVIGGVSSLAGGIADISINEQLRNEALDYTKDQFGYQLGNIQALPNTISKISSLNGNNKLFPILEYYTCTDEEKIAFLNKIAWNGMTIMIIGKMNDYINNSWTYNGIESKGYIKGRLIRIPEIIGEDLHVANTIANELNKGIFIGVN
jgi:outer membrane lipoprotein SlyB